MTVTPEERDGTGEPDDDRYTFVDVRDLDDHDDEPAARRPRQRTARRTTSKGKTTIRKTPAKKSRSRGRGGEFAIGALVCMVAIGYAAYWLTHDVMGQSRDVCLVSAGLAAGLSTWSQRGLVTLRRALARKIAPKGAR